MEDAIYREVLLPELKKYKEKAFEYYDRRDIRRREFPPCANNISRPGLIRMLAILNVIAKELKEKGYYFENNGYRLSFKDDNNNEVCFKFEESRFTVPTKSSNKYKDKKNRLYSMTPDKMRFYTGYLRLSFKENEHWINKTCKSFKDTDNCSLDERTDEIINHVLDLFPTVIEKNEKERQKELTEKERKEKREREFNETIDLCKKALEYELSRKIINYISNCPDSEYKEWAEKKAHWIDPFHPQNDSILTEQHKKGILRKIINYPDSKNVNWWSFY